MLYYPEYNVYGLSERQRKLLTILAAYLVSLSIDAILKALINALIPKKKGPIEEEEKNTISISKEEVKKIIPVCMVALGATGAFCLYRKLTLEVEEDKEKDKNPSSNFNNIRGGDLKEFSKKSLLYLADLIRQSEAVKNKQPLEEDRILQEIRELLAEFLGWARPGKQKERALHCNVFGPSNLYYVNNRELVKRIIEVLQKTLRTSYTKADSVAITPALYSLIVMNSMFFRVMGENVSFSMQNRIVESLRFLIDYVHLQTSHLYFYSKSELLDSFYKKVGRTLITYYGIMYGPEYGPKAIVLFGKKTLAAGKFGGKIVNYFIPNSLKKRCPNVTPPKWIKNTLTSTTELVVSTAVRVKPTTDKVLKLIEFLKNHHKLVLLTTVGILFLFDPIYSCYDFLAPYESKEVNIVIENKGVKRMVFLELSQDEKYIKNLQDLPSVIVTTSSHVIVDNQKQMKPEEADIINQDSDNPIGVVKSDYPRDVRKIETSNIEIFRTGDDAKDLKIYGKIMDLKISIPLQRSERDFLKELQNRRDNPSGSNPSREKKSRVKAHRFNTKIHTMKDWDNNKNQDFDFDSGDIIDLDSETVIDVPFEEIKIKEELKIKKENE